MAGRMRAAAAGRLRAGLGGVWRHRVGLRGWLGLVPLSLCGAAEPGVRGEGPSPIVRGNKNVLVNGWERFNVSPWNRFVPLCARAGHQGLAGPLGDPERFPPLAAVCGFSSSFRTCLSRERECFAACGGWCGGESVSAGGTVGEGRGDNRYSSSAPKLGQYGGIKDDRGVRVISDQKPLVIS